jgi:hypothetical protein
MARDWARIAYRQSIDYVGTPEFHDKMAQFKRYDLLATKLAEVNEELERFKRLQYTSTVNDSPNPEGEKQA